MMLMLFMTRSSPANPPLIDPATMHALLSADHPLTAAALAQELRTSPLEAARRVEALRRAGCVIETNPQRGLSLRSISLPCWPDYIEQRHARRLGTRLIAYHETASTQDAARRLVASPGEHHGHVLVADQQTAGRGRLGRRWHSAPGAALLMTAVVRRAGLTVDRLMLGSCCAVARTLEALAPIAAQIRWPNDLLIDGAKACGILVETAGDWALVGIGVNVRVDPRDLPDRDGPSVIRVASLHTYAPTLDRLAVLDRLLDELDRALAGDSDDVLHQFWLSRSCLQQQRLTVRDGDRQHTGRVIDLDPRHGLLLAADTGGIVTIPAATASLVL